MSEIKQEDRRVQRTKSQLWEALLKQSRERSWENINVRGICTEANVARSSFYLHFNNKFDLLDFGFSHGMEAARIFVQSSKTEEVRWATFDWLFTHIAGKHEFYKETGPANEFIFARFQRSVCELLTYELTLKRKACSSEAVAFAVGGVFSVLKTQVAKQGHALGAKQRNQLNHWTNLVLGIKAS